MTTFYNNFISLCQLHNVSVSKVAESIGLSRAAPNGWKKGKIPEDYTIQRLSDYFGVSFEELSGFSLSSVPTFYKVLLSLCSNLNESPSTVSRKLGLSNSTPTSWKSGKTPSDTTLAKLSNYFGVTTDYLLTGAQKEKPSAENGEELQIPYYDDLSEENKAKAREYIEMLLKLQGQ